VRVFSVFSLFFSFSQKEAIYIQKKFKSSKRALKTRRKTCKGMNATSSYSLFLYSYPRRVCF